MLIDSLQQFCVVILASQRHFSRASRSEVGG